MFMTLTNNFNTLLFVFQLYPMIEEQYQTYNNFVVYTLNLTKEDLHLSKDEFCKSVPKICDETYEIPEELKINKTVTGADKEKVDELHEKVKEIVDEVNRRNEISSKEVSNFDVNYQLQLQKKIDQICELWNLLQATDIDKR